jgi:hypothetical protein
MTTLLRKAGVVDDPGLDRFVPGDRWHDPFTHTAQHGLIRPRGLRHKMQQRLVLSRGSLRRGHRRKWLNAFAALGGQQPDTVVLERSDPVGMPQNRCQVRRIGAKPCLRRRLIAKIHPIPPGKFESPLLPNRNRVAPSAIFRMLRIFATQ